MEKNMETTIMSYIRDYFWIHSSIPGQGKESYLLLPQHSAVDNMIATQQYPEPCTLHPRSSAITRSSNQIPSDDVGGVGCSMFTSRHSNWATAG